MEEGGILIAQVGEASRMQSPAENIGLNRNRVNFIRTLGNLGFNAIRDYEEVRGISLRFAELFLSFLLSPVTHRFLAPTAARRNK